MAVRILVFVWAAVIGLGGCATIPNEAPELSTELGVRLSALEAAHVRLLEEFFAEKRRRVDEFVQEVWVPIFAQEFFADPEIENVWSQVVRSSDPRDRVEFIVRVGPRLQSKINQKRVELIQPLDALEDAVRKKLKTEYDHARAINNTLTAFLHSAAKVDENRRRYLEMVGIADQALDEFVSETDRAVSALVGGARKAERLAADADKYRQSLLGIIDKLRK
jgi:hypothetical protein